MKKTIYAPIFVLALLLLTGGNVWAQNSNGIPKEGDIFYMEDLGNGHKSSMKKSPRQEETNPWQFTSVIENCFDPNLKGKEAWLMTADGETKLNYTFKYLGNDPMYTIESAEIEYYFYDGNDLFHDENKVLVTDANLVGNYTKEVTEKAVTVHVTAPNVFPMDYPNIAWYSYYMVIRIKFKNIGESAVAKQIGVSRNGLLLMHGLNSNDECFVPFYNYLANTKKCYFSLQVQLQDYRKSNTSSFYANTHQNRIVENGLKTLSGKLYEVGIASTKYDMIGHSMGGILSRLYNQEIDNKHTNKLMTLNTPHFGSKLGDYFIELEAAQAMDSYVADWFGEKFDKAKAEVFADDASRQAVEDLATRSAPIQELGYHADKMNGIRVCAVGTEIDWVNYEGIKYAVSEPFYQAYGYLAQHIFNKEVKHERNYLDENANGTDFVVTVESQKGGCSKSYIYKGTWGQAMHCNCTSWSVVHDQLYYLLTSAPTYEFSLTGFGTPPSTARYLTSDYSDKFVTSFADPLPTSFIKIQASEVDDPNFTHKLKLTHSNDMMTTMAFSILSKDDLIADYDKDEMNFDMSGFEGKQWIYAVGRTNYNAVVMDSVKVVLGDPSGIKSVNQTPESNIKYAVQGNELIVKNVSGPYTVVICDIAGRVLEEMQSNPYHVYMLPQNKDLMIVGVRTSNGQKFVKLKK